MGIPRVPKGLFMGKEFFDKMPNRNPSMIQRDIDSVHLKRVLLCKEILHDGLKGLKRPYGQGHIDHLFFFFQGEGFNPFCH
jgi:agmatine/peptidylarginine deiminase